MNHNTLGKFAAMFAGVFLLACGDDGSSSGQDVAISDKTISGVSQKGPFVKGSSVTVYELGGESLSQTGKSYEGKIKNERGEFSVDVVKLESQYALLKAEGYYRNEITGGKSNGTVTLYAMTDLSNRSEVNVNLLTHLEYERSRYLVKNKKMNVADAKKQAEREVLKSFGIEGDFESSESLNIFEAGDGNAALLAVSVLMQGNLKEADFTERLNDYASDIEEDGSWDDEKMATQIADWAVSQGMGSGLALIRNNIANWGLSTGVPIFEKYVDNFWWQNYGLGTCDKEREGEVKKNQNLGSINADKYFICRSSSWNEATALEYDTYEWEKGKDGEVRTGKINKGFYYIYDAGKKIWREASDVEKDTYQWTEGEDGEKRPGDVTGKVYTYFASWKKWFCVEYWDLNVPKYVYLNPDIKYDSITDARDNQIYKVVKIGNQVWMAENLNYSDSLKTPSLKGNMWCYDDKLENCAVAGRLYTWTAAIDSVKLANDTSNPQNCGYNTDCVLPAKVQGICPQGWHLPDSTEWNALIAEAGGADDAGKKLKSRIGWTQNGEGENTYGFSAMSGGEKGCANGFCNGGDFVHFWGAEYDGGNANCMEIGWEDYAALNHYSTYNGFPIRCIKDADE